MSEASSDPQRPVVVVTGATGGLGRHVARGLAAAGRRVVLVGRDAGRAEAARRWIAEDVADAALEVELADLSLVRETRALGERIAARHPQVSVLVNNAGVFHARRERTSEGIERVLATNLLSPVVLTQTLLLALKAGAPSRIVNVGSSSSDRAHIGRGGLDLGRHWSFTAAYAQSKLALLMATRVMADALTGTGVVANVVHPGLVASGLIKTPGPIGWAWRLMAPFSLSEEEGADTPLHVALSDDFATVSSAYVKARRPVRPNRQVLDASVVSRVWAETQSLIASATKAGGTAR